MDRSEIMRRVRSKDTSPELKVRRLIHQMGFRYRLHRKDVIGHPDLLFPSKNKIIFVHGCFWHGHVCKRGARTPKTNTNYWQKKIRANVDRDIKILTALKNDGWDILIVWECEIKNRNNLSNRILEFLT